MDDTKSVLCGSLWKIAKFHCNKITSKRQYTLAHYFIHFADLSEYDASFKCLYTWWINNLYVKDRHFRNLIWLFIHWGYHKPIFISNKHNKWEALNMLCRRFTLLMMCPMHGITIVDLNFAFNSTITRHWTQADSHNFRSIQIM